MSRLEELANGSILEQDVDSSRAPCLQIPPVLVPQGKSATFQTSYEVDKHSSRTFRMRQKYNDIRDEERKNNNDLLNFAHRSVQRDTVRQVGLSSGEISKHCGNSPRRSPPRKVYIQNSSALVRREQELLNKPALAREGSVGTSVTRSLTATTVSLGDLTLTEVPDNDSKHGVGQDLVEDASVQALSDDEEYDNETEEEGEESSDDEREWRKDSDVLHILHLDSEEDQIYEGSSTSSSGYVTEDHHNLDPSDDSLEASSMSSVNSSAWRICDPISEGENETETDAETDKSDICSHLSENESQTKAKADMPVAVVFEMDDMTDDSQKISEDGLLRFVKDFTEDLKEETTKDGVGKTPRPSVRLYSTVGAKRSERIEILKQKVLSSETIVSTILEKRAMDHEKGVEVPQSHGPVQQGVSAKATAASVTPMHRKRFSKEFSSEDIVAAIRDANPVEETSSIHMVSRTDSHTQPTEEELKQKRQDSSRGKVAFTGSEIKRERAAKNATDLRQLQQRNRAREAKATEILAAAKEKHQAEHRDPPQARSSATNEPALRTNATVSCTTSTLREEIKRRRQRIKSLKESQSAPSEGITSRDDARALLEQRRDRVKSLRDGSGNGKQEKQKTSMILSSRKSCSGREGGFNGELGEEVERRSQRLNSFKECSSINPLEPHNETTDGLSVPTSTTSRKGKNAIKPRTIKHEDSSAGTLTVVTSNRSSEDERRRMQASNYQAASSVSSSKKSNFSGFIGRLLGKKKSHGQVSKKNGTTSNPNKTREELQHCASSVVSTPLRRPKKDERSTTSSRRGDLSGSFPIPTTTRNNAPSHIPFFGGHSQRHPTDNSDPPILSKSWQHCNGEDDAQSVHTESGSVHTESQSGAQFLRLHCSNFHLRRTLEDVDVISFDELGTSTALASASWV